MGGSEQIVNYYFPITRLRIGGRIGATDATAILLYDWKYNYTPTHPHRKTSIEERGVRGRQRVRLNAIRDDIDGHDKPASFVQTIKRVRCKSTVKHFSANCCGHHHHHRQFTAPPPLTTIMMNSRLGLGYSVLSCFLGQCRFNIYSFM